MQYQSGCLEALKSAAKINKPFEKVFMDTLKLFMAIPGKVNFFQMGRYGEFSEQTYRNNFENETFASVNIAKAACKELGIPFSISSCKSIIHNAYMLNDLFECPACNRTHKLLTNFSKNWFYLLTGPLRT